MLTLNVFNHIFVQRVQCMVERSNFSFLYTRRRRGVLWDHPWKAGERAVSPILCLEHICKTMLAMVMKFHRCIDLIKAECSAQEP